MQWDYIVIGAGSAGCAVTHELVRSGRKVLLIEAGGSDRSLWLRIPAGTWSIPSRFDWGYRSQPDPTRSGAAELWHRGRVLGGTSSINGMIYVRGAAGDYDRWSRLCSNRGQWSAEDVMSVFRRIEHSDQDSPWRGHDGPLYVRTIRKPHAVTDAFVESVCATGVPFNPDYNGHEQYGVGYLQLTQHRGLRFSAADAFLRPILRRDNLRLCKHAVVHKLEIVGDRVSAVTFAYKGRQFTESARNVILCAGAINTPKLLMLSGIGDPEELRRHNIATVRSLSGVGANLREHSLISLTYRCRSPTYNLTEGVLHKLAIAGKYWRFHEGPIASAYEAAAFLKIHPSAEAPQLQVFFAPIGWARDGESMKLAPYPAMKVCVINSHSVSRGRVRLASSHPADPPLIECRLLESDTDIERLVISVTLVRGIMNAKPIADIVEEEIAPGAMTTGAEALRAYVRQHVSTTCHPVGTCGMGLNADSVVGPDLRVHGIDNLWIADASILPNTISANMNAPCIMIGAKLGRQLSA